MLEIAIHIEKRYLRMFPVTVRSKVSLPASWQEVDTNNVIQLYGFLLKYEKSYATVKALEVLLKLKKTQFLALSENQLTDLVATMDWYKIEPTSKAIMSSFTHNSITYHLPSEGMENISAIEYTIADDYYNDFVEEENEESLRFLVATICREENPNQQEQITKGDKRIALLSRYEAEARAKRLADLSTEICTMVLSYFIGCKMLIHETYGTWLFEKNDDDVAQANDGVFMGWLGIYMDVAETGIFGNLQSVYQSYFHTICIHLVKKRKEGIEYEKRIQAAMKKQ
jgi:hypothetical protein